MANPFCFWYIVEIRARFFYPIPAFQANCFRLNEIKLLVILTLNR
jgi:hypothetical protein